MDKIETAHRARMLAYDAVNAGYTLRDSYYTEDGRKVIPLIVLAAARLCAACEFPPQDPAWGGVVTEHTGRMGACLEAVPRFVETIRALADYPPDGYGDGLPRVQHERVWLGQLTERHGDLENSEFIPVRAETEDAAWTALNLIAQVNRSYAGPENLVDANATGRSRWYWTDGEQSACYVEDVRAVDGIVIGGVLFIPAMHTTTPERARAEYEKAVAEWRAENEDDEAETCSRCGGPLDHSGEGYLDLCPKCADETEPDYDEDGAPLITGTPRLTAEGLRVLGREDEAAAQAGAAREHLAERGTLPLPRYEVRPFWMEGRNNISSVSLPEWETGWKGAGSRFPSRAPDGFGVYENLTGERAGEQRSICDSGSRADAERIAAALNGATIVIEVRGGMVYPVEAIPPGITVEVRDYDAPEGGSNPDGEDEDGDPYCIEEYEAVAQP